MDFLHEWLPRGSQEGLGHGRHKEGHASCPTATMLPAQAINNDNNDIDMSIWDKFLCGRGGGTASSCIKTMPDLMSAALPRNPDKDQSLWACAPHSPDLAPADFWLFPQIKKLFLQGLLCNKAASRRWRQPLRGASGPEGGGLTTMVHWTFMRGD